MAKQTINIGASANDGTGDPLRNAFDKANDNFNEIYLAIGTGTNATGFFDANQNLDLPGKPHKISFLYNTLADLEAVNPSTYHGCIGHAHDVGNLYYAHSGAWVRLAKFDDLGSAVSANTFGTIAISGQTSVVAENSTDTLNIAAGDNIALTTSSDTVTIAAENIPNSFDKIVVAGADTVEADTGTDTLTLVAGSNISITTDASADSITINATGGGGGGGGTDLNSVTAGTVDVAADSYGFIDATDSNNTKKATIASLVSAIAGDNLTATDGVLAAAAGYGDSDVDTHLNTSGASANEYLQWSGSDYQWAAVSGGSSATRVTEAETTASLADGASGNVAYADLGKSFALYTVTVDKASWIRIYSDTSSRTADASRTQGQDPSEGAGIIAEFVATSPNTTFKITPAVYGYIDDGESTLPVAVQNNSGSAGTVQVSITALKLES